MNKGTKTAVVTLTGVLAGVFWSGVASATERVIVQMRSPGAFHQLQGQLNEALHLNRTSTDAFGRRQLELPRVANTNARLTTALEHLEMVVLEVESDADIATLQKNPDVQFVERERFYPTPRLPLSVSRRRNNTFASTEQMPWGISAVKAPAAWAEATTGAQGAGATVLVLDTGIDRDHPDLKERLLEGKNFFTRRLAQMPSLNSFLLAASPIDADEQDATTPPYDYFDEVGHGTHVSGTILGAQNGIGVVGVAPQANLLMGRVCGELGCSSVAIVNGINWAIQKRADVISMSLGGPSDVQSQAQAIQKAEQAGIVTVAASGNDGTDKVSYPGATPNVIAVGAVDSTGTRATFSQYGPELAIVAPGVDVVSSVPVGSGRDSIVSVQSGSDSMQNVPSTSFVGSPAPAQPVVGTLALAGIGKPDDFKNGNVKNKIALIQRGEIPFADKVKNAIDAGAVGVAIYNNVDGLTSGALSEGGEVAVPVIMIEKTVGEQLKTAIGQGQASSMSLMIAKTDYASFQGTSMATPHVAGVVALIRAANKNLTPAQVRTIIKSTAVAHAPTSANEYGAGLVDAAAAVAAAQR